MRPVFADLKSDFVFKKVFGSEAHKDILIALLNALLARDDTDAITDLTYLREDERPKVEELKHSIVDVKCRDARGHYFVVEMQVLQVEGFDKRVVYNASKAYVNQLARGEGYATLADVVAVSVCDFVLWPDEPGQAVVPLVSHWRMQEQASGRTGLAQVRYVFVELPKFPLDRVPHDVTEEWAYVFRRAPTLREVPAQVTHEGPRKALAAARSAAFTAEEWEAYDRESVAIGDARGALSFAERRGRQEGREEGRQAGREDGLREARRTVLRTLASAVGITFSSDDEARIETCDELATLDRWILATSRARTAADIFGE